jgi:MFS family permease
MPEKTEKSNFYGWVLLPVLCLVYSIPIGFAMYGPPIINTFMAEELKLQRWQVNVGYSIIGIVLGLGSLFIPWLINRFGPKKTLAIGAVIAAIASILMALMGSTMVSLFGQPYPLVYWIICLFVGLGVSFGTVVPVQALVLLWFNVHRALAMGLVLGGGAIGGFVYPQIISNCITFFGNDWRVGWYVVAIACFIGAIVALMAVRNRPEELGQHPDGLSPEQLEQAAKNAKHELIRTYRSPINWTPTAAFKTRSLWLIMISTTVIFFLWQVLLTQTPAHLSDRGFSATDPLLFRQPAFIYGLILAFSIVGRLSVSFFGEKIESRFIIAIAGFLLVIGGVFFWLASKDNLWAVYLFPLFTGIGFGATYVSIPLIVGNYFGVGSFPDLMRAINPVNCVFQFSAPAVAGLIYDVNHNYGMAILIACIVGLIGTVLIIFCKPPVPDQAA